MMNVRVSCVLMGEGSLLIQCGNALLERGHEVRAVATSGAAVAEWARARELRVVAPGRTLADDISDIQFDWFFSIANLRIVQPAIWRRAGTGAVNFHDGPLPRHAGLNAPAWALLAGERNYGVTWHALTEGIDEGDVYAQSFFDVADDDTAFSINTKCFEAGISSFVDLLDRIEGGRATGQPQDLAERSYHARNDRPHAGAVLDFSLTAAEIGRLGRALSFGQGYVNPLGLPKIWLGRGACSIGELSIQDGGSERPAGWVLSADDQWAEIACADGIVRIGKLTDETGAAVVPSGVLRLGERLAPLGSALTSRIEAVKSDFARSEPFFSRRLESFQDVEFYGVQAPTGHEPQWDIRDVSLPAGLAGDRATAGLLAALARLSGQDRFSVAYAHDALMKLAREMPGVVARTVPLNIGLSKGLTVGSFAAAVAAELTEVRRRVGYFGDLAARQARPLVLAPTVAIVQTAEATMVEAVPNAALTIVVPESSVADKPIARVLYDRLRLADDEALAMACRVEAALAAFASDAARPVSALPLMSAQETAEVIEGRNRSRRDYDRSARTHTLIEAQARRTPDAVALVHGDRELTYRQLDDLANRVAQDLAARGVGPDSLVGLHVRRSCDLVVGALAVWKAGGAYVPLDPTYPADRVALMIEDSGLRVLIADPGAAPANLPPGIDVLTVAGALEARPYPQALPPREEPHHLAYVIYTSGSTGRPKGVMVEHRNVVNFFAGMDDRIARADGAQPVWLAVTSLSFDISVLELFWTLANGFKVVIHSDESRKHDAAPSSGSGGASVRGMKFGLFYWGDDDVEGADKYRLLLEGSRFADSHGFNAVWTPERHFSAFGGPYPNPAVTGAAVAAITRNVSVRAGSCVLPLHHPARVAEDWAIIDNLSNGRVAVAMASGWMPEDFLLRPENAPPANKSAMLRDIDVVRRLWRGEKVAFAAPGGKVVDITTLPRPVQRELPVWLTTAGNPETFREAARMGVNVLTHLLGQSIEEVAEKVRIYREELVKVGRNPADHTVTLMLHTLVGRDREVVREQARGPMKHYLRSAAMLIKEYAWAFPAFKKPKGVARPMDLDLQTLSEDELEAILEFAFLRYFDDSGLFGTVEEAKLRVEQLAAIGIDEIACLIDFGVPADTVLSALEPLAEVVAAFRTEDLAQPIAATATPPLTVTAGPVVEESIGALIRRHAVTHLQCTPAMATMLLSSDEDRGALHLVRHLFLGGEALQGTLLREIGQVTQASIENMYGPTETTIWSSTTPALPTDGNVPLGTPIANTQLYVLDNKLRPQPVGLPGELYIGGDGVTRGYFKRDDLTAERFLPNPFVTGGRVYRTGDLVRIGGDGALHFMGRADFQVKVRGYRIELGEIENCLGLHPAVSQAVVVAREDVRNDVRIVAYIRFKAAKVSDDTLRAHLRQTLPEFMVPAHFVAMEQFPLTPNAKVDRKALPRPDAAVIVAPAQEYVAPTSDVERQIADVFKRILGLDRVGLNDNFFGLGGHSLLAVQAHRAIKAEVTQDLKITDIYRFPTVAGLAGHLRGGQQADKSLDKVAARAAQRRNAMAGRRAGVARSEN